MSSRRKQLITAVGLGMLVGAFLIFATSLLPPFGTFPQRGVGGFQDNSIGQRMLENVENETGAANAVTSIVWDYRGYDTLGEATVLFTAVTGTAMLFVARRME